MSDKPLVSIIMPAFNAGRFIEQAIVSVLAQSYENWELLITDDGSTDDTGEIIKKFDDPRIRNFSQANQGVSAARNRALSEMSGAFFTFLDADDLLPANSLATRIQFFQENSRVDMLAGSVSFFREAPEQSHKVWSARFRGDPLRALIRLDESVFCNPSFLLRRRDNVDYSFRLDMTHGEDLLFFLKLAAESKLFFDYIESTVYHYRVGSDSAMSNLKGLEKGYWQILAAVSAIRDDRIAWRDRLYLRLRIGRIMFLSYLRAGNIFAALQVLVLTLSPLR